MYACEHVFVAEIFEVVLLRLRAKSAGVIGVQVESPGDELNITSFTRRTRRVPARNAHVSSPRLHASQ